MPPIKAFRITSRHRLDNGQVRTDSHDLPIGYKRLGPNASPATINSIPDALVEMLEGGFLEDQAPENEILSFHIEKVFRSDA